MDEQREDDQLEPIYNNSVLIQDVALKTYRERWTIETGGERGSGRSVLAALHDNVDDIIVYKLVLDRNTWNHTILYKIFVLDRRCPWCNGYRHRKWTQRHEFKSWTRLIAFHIALIPLGKVWIQLFSLQLWVNSTADWVLQPWWGN